MHNGSYGKRSSVRQSVPQSRDRRDGAEYVSLRNLLFCGYEVIVTSVVCMCAMPMPRQKLYGAVEFVACSHLSEYRGRVLIYIRFNYRHLHSTYCQWILDIRGYCDFSFNIN